MSLKAKTTISENFKNLFVEEIINQASYTHASKIHNIILEIFKDNNIDVSDIPNIVNSCKRIIRNNGDEILYYNETPLILFKPLKFVQEIRDGKITVGVVQSWIKLYKNED